MMKKFGLLICLFIAFSCSNDDDGTQEAAFAYKGSWSGTYQGGGDMGTFNAIIAQSGAVTGTVESSNIEGYTMVVDGTVDDTGELTATLTFGSEQVGTFTGTLTETSGTGIWNTTYMGFEFSGTWTGDKE